MIYKVASKQLLDDLVKEEGALAESEGKYYHFSNNAWEEIGEDFKLIKGAGNVKMSIYESNQQINSQLKALTEEEIIKKKDLLGTFYQDNKEYSFFAMLSWELHYFTVFIKDYFNINYKDETLGEAVIDCLSYVGDIKSIELGDCNDIEIWVTTFDNQTECIHLFPYDSGMVPFKGVII